MERNSRLAHDFAVVAGVLRNERDANADRDPMFDPGDREARAECLDHPQGDAGGFLCSGQLTRENHEFIATPARHEVSVAHDLRQACRDTDEYLVAGGMPIAVVDALEVLQVQQQDGVRSAAAWRRCDRRLELAVELAAVRHPGEGVLVGRLARLMLGGDSPCHLQSLRPRQAPGQQQKPDAE